MVVVAILVVGIAAVMPVGIVVLVVVTRMGRHDCSQERAIRLDSWADAGDGGSINNRSENERQRERTTTVVVG